MSPSSCLLKARKSIFLAYNRLVFISFFRGSSSWFSSWFCTEKGWQHKAQKRWSVRASLTCMGSQREWGWLRWQSSWLGKSIADVASFSCMVEAWSCFGQNRQWLFVVLLLNTLQCFGPYFFHKYSINAKSISTENRLKYVSIHILKIFQIKAKKLWWIFHFTSSVVSWQPYLCVVNWT